MVVYSHENDNGKSAFHRCLGLLITRGQISGRQVITGDQFNGPLAGAVLCYIDEDKLPAESYSTIKNLVDSPKVTIRMMRIDPFDFPNYSHWIQTANDVKNCPVQGDDKRVIMVDVPVLPEGNKIPWDGGDDAEERSMVSFLTEEAPYFLGTLLSLELPPSSGRLFLPVLETDLKREALNKPVPKPQRDASQLTKAIENFMSDRSDWEGTSTELLTELGSGNWPTNPALFSQTLGEVRENITGCSVTLPSDGNRTGSKRSISISKTEFALSL